MGIPTPQGLIHDPVIGCPDVTEIKMGIRSLLLNTFVIFVSFVVD